MLDSNVSETGTFSVPDTGDPVPEQLFQSVDFWHLGLEPGGRDDAPPAKLSVSEPHRPDALHLIKATAATVFRSAETP